MNAEKHVVRRLLEQAFAAVARIFAPSPATEGPPTLAHQAERWCELDRTRKSFDRQAKALKKQQDKLTPALIKAVRDKAEIPGFQLFLDSKQSQVSWANAYEELAGVEKAEALRKAQPWHDVLIVRSLDPADLVPTEPEV